MPNVARLSITPVKGTALHSPDEVRLEDFGVAENRLFFLVDVDGRLLSGARCGELVQLLATYLPEEERLAVVFPGGIRVEESSMPDGEAIEVDFWGRLTGGRVVRAWSEPLSAFVGQPVRLVRAEHLSGGTDVRPLTLVSSASVEELSRQANVEDADSRRFRMLIEVGGCEPHEEDGWTGRLLRIGDEALVRAGKPVPRCLVVTHNPESGATDLKTLKFIHAYRGRSAENTLDFGIYGDVETPGTVRVGDPIEVL